MDLKKLRAELKLSQVEMAKKIGVALSTYRYWEYGQHMPSPMAWERIKKMIDNNEGKRYIEFAILTRPPGLEGQIL